MASVLLRRLSLRNQKAVCTNAVLTVSVLLCTNFVITVHLYKVDLGALETTTNMMKVMSSNKGLCALVRWFFEVVQFFSRTFFQFLYKAPGKSMPQIDDFLLLDSATTLAKKIRTRQVTSVQVVSSFIKRIKQVNPTFNCVVDLRFHEALEDARQIDEEIAKNTKTEQQMEEETPFLGVPFTFKSCISCKGMRNTAGLVARRRCIADEDADVVVFMKNAGAIPLASTNVSELCLWWESYNTLHGRTNNPYDTNHSVGGSSGGEGCIQALAASPMGLGSDIGGSIRIPAQFNGVFGHKPTNGYSFVKGHYPFPRYPTLRPLLVIGPMSRFASDLKPMMKILSQEYNKELNLHEEVQLKKLRFFYMDDDGGSVIVSRVDPEIKAKIQKIVKYFEETHGITVQKVNLKKLRYAMMLWFSKMKSKEGPVIAKELANFRGSKNLLWEMLKFCVGATDHTLPVLITAILERIGLKYGDPQHTFYINKCEQLKKDFEKLLGNDGIFICPTLPTAAPYHWEAAFRPFDISYTAAFNCLGFPVTHCPMGLNSKGLPIGIQIVAPEKHDRYSIAVAEELERAFGGWVPPPFRISKTE